MRFRVYTSAGYDNTITHFEVEKETDKFWWLAPTAHRLARRQEKNLNYEAKTFEECKKLAVERVQRSVRHAHQNLAHAEKALLAFKNLKEK